MDFNHHRSRSTGIRTFHVHFRGRLDVTLESRFVDRYAKRPTASDVLASLYSFRTLLKHLVMKDLKLKYRGSFFGFLWSLANPLLMIVAYSMAFTYILRIRGGFVFYLMVGLLSLSFFANSIGMATGAIVENSGLLKSVAFPRRFCRSRRCSLILLNTC